MNDPDKSRLETSRAPSNAALAERMARVEANTEHVADTLDRIEDNLAGGQDELAEQVDENTERVGSVWTTYRIARWVVPAVAAVASAGAAVVTI